MLKGKREMLRNMLAKRFGKLPPHVTKRIARMSETEVEDLGPAMLDAGSVDDLFLGYEAKPR